MIVIKLQGGLGNQLFQFAAGYSLAQKKRVRLGIDISWFNDSNLREPLLLKLKPASCQLINGKSLNQSYFFKLREKFTPYYRRSVFVEQHLNFDSNFFKAKDNTHLAGYWQTEKYFVDHRDYLQSIVYGYRPIDVSSYIGFENSLGDIRTVGVHVRRGDYLLEKNMQIHGVCSLEYYEEAIEFMRSKLKDPPFMIFSDDMDWCKKVFSKIPNIKFVQADSPDSIFELSLLSRCHSQIISNSSFSWWGAWLNDKVDKVVVAPKRWFAEEKLQSQTSDLLPSSWLTI